MQEDKGYVRELIHHTGLKLFLITTRLRNPRQCFDANLTHVKSPNLDPRLSLSFASTKREAKESLVTRLGKSRRLYTFHEIIHATRVVKYPREDWASYPKITREGLPLDKAYTRVSLSHLHLLLKILKGFSWFHETVLLHEKQSRKRY